MSTHEERIETSNLPFRVPCPPPALRLPPNAYRTPPQTLSSTLRSIPPPPIGTRFPGDRVAWPPLVFPNLDMINTMPKMMEKEISGIDLTQALALCPESACHSLTIIEEPPDLISKNEPASVTADNRSTAVLDIDDCHEGTLNANIEVIQHEGDGIHENELKNNLPYEEPFLNQVACLPGASVLWKELPMAADSIVIKELAVILGIPCYLVLRDLIEIGIFLKPTDSLSAETANEIGCKYGVCFVTRDSISAEGALGDDFLKTAVPGGLITED